MTLFLLLVGWLALVAVLAVVSVHMDSNEDWYDGDNDDGE